MNIPKVETIRDQTLSYSESRLGQTIPRIKKGYFFVQDSAVAGVINLAYRFVNWCLDQTQPSTCNEFWLAIWSDRYGVTRSPAVAAVLRLDATGVNGSTIPSGTLWATSSGVVYQQTTDITIAAGVGAPTITCLTLGALGNLADGAPVSLVSPVAGVDSGAAVDSTTAVGVDLQSVADWRTEVVDRIRYQPQGGAIPDYVQRALEVPGIVKALVDGGGGDVNVYPLQALTGDDRVPGAPLLAEVLDHLEDPLWKPMGANVFALATVERTCEVTITTATVAGVSLTTDQKAQVQGFVSDALFAAYPVQYPDEPAPTDTIDIGIGWDALRAIGATAATVAINISGIGGGPYRLPVGEIIKLDGNIVWA